MSGSDSLRIVGCPSFGRTGLPRLALECGVSSFRLRFASVSGFPRPWLNNRMPCGGSFSHPRFSRGTRRVSQVLERFSTCVPRSKVDPGRPSRTSPKIGPSVLASATVNNVAVCIKRHDGAVSSFGVRGLSCGLHVSLCTLQPTCSAFRLLSRSCNTR